MKISIGILSYSINAELISLTKLAIESYKNYSDELIVVENGGRAINYNCDTYVRYNKNLGATKGYNSILQIANGDYILLVNNDTYLQEGDLRDLCIPDAVTSPLLDTDPDLILTGACVMIPRKILDQVGLWDERLRTFWSDIEWFDRLEEKGINYGKVESVRVHHDGNKTMAVTDEANSETSERDRIIMEHITGKSAYN